MDQSIGDNRMKISNVFLLGVIFLALDGVILSVVFENNLGILALSLSGLFGAISLVLKYFKA
jgi:hypothetical protein